MRPYPVVTIFLLVICMAVQFPPVGGMDAGPSRDGTVDLAPVLNHPTQGGKYTSDHGFVANITVHNHGSVDMPDQGQLTMSLRAFSTGDLVFSAISRTISGIAAGGQASYKMQNWTGAFPGKYICNVTVQYPPDSNRNNNFAECVFTLYTDFWPYPPKLDSWSVSPSKGNSTTAFTYTVNYIHNYLPMEMLLEIDGVNRTVPGSDPDDDNAQDGKEYKLSTLLPIGNHQYRFFCKVNSTRTIMSNMTQGPWVNISFRNPYVYPDYGYVTTDFKFSIEYGSSKNLEPDEIYLRAGSKDFDLVRTTPTPNYLKGDVRFEVSVKGMDLVPSPVQYSFHCRTQTDTYSLGPFFIDGPDMRMAKLSGKVMDLEGDPLENATVSLDPGISTRTGPDGAYNLTTYLGTYFLVTYSAEGYEDRSYIIDIMANRRLDIQLVPIPSGGTLQGQVTYILDGAVLPVPGALVNLTTGEWSLTTLTDLHGNYTLSDVIAGSAQTIKVSEHRFHTHTGTVKILDGKVTTYNVTLTERPMDVSVSPDPSEGPVPVGAMFKLKFARSFQMTSATVGLTNSSSEIAASLTSNGTELTVTPSRALNFDETVSLHLSAGVMDDGGKPLVWRDVSWSYVVERQAPGTFNSDPPADSTDIPLLTNISFSFGIALDRSTLDISLKDLDRGLDIPLIRSTFIDSVNWSDSGRTDTLVTVQPAPLNFSTRYSLQISSGLKDVFGRALMSTSRSLEFRTIDEKDTDGDGTADSQDLFPNDPSEWSDRDGDGYGDNLADRFPDDPDEWRDTDGDTKGDNADEDDDNDGMPDVWELTYELDPLDPDDAFLDPDGDDYSNLKEYLAGTDPKDKNDRPEKGSGNWTSLLILIGLIVLILIVIAAGAAFILKRSREGRESMPTLEE